MRHRRDPRPAYRLFPKRQAGFRARLVGHRVILPSLRTYRSIWRLSGLTDFLRIVAATGAIVVGAVALGVWFNRTDGSVPALAVVQGLLILFFLVGVRVLMRLSYAARERSAQWKAAGEACGDETILVIGLSPENAPLGANIAQGIDIFWD
jgi:FlaA1/EpsC-like NDP-sugar epimerase